MLKPPGLSTRVFFNLSSTKEDTPDSTSVFVGRVLINPRAEQDKQCLCLLFYETKCSNSPHRCEDRFNAVSLMQGHLSQHGLYIIIQCSHQLAHCSGVATTDLSVARSTPRQVHWLDKEQHKACSSHGAYLGEDMDLCHTALALLNKISILGDWVKTYVVLPGEVSYPVKNIFPLTASSDPVFLIFSHATVWTGRSLTLNLIWRTQYSCRREEIRIPTDYQLKVVTNYLQPYILHNFHFKSSISLDRVRLTH